MATIPNHDKIVNMKNTPDNYQAWDIKLSDFPKKGTLEEKIKFFTQFGILAANIHNTQPWLFLRNNEHLTQLVIYQQNVSHHKYNKRSQFRK